MADLIFKMVHTNLNLNIPEFGSNIGQKCGSNIGYQITLEVK